MKKLFFMFLGVISATGFALDNIPAQPGAGNFSPPHDSAGFTRSMTGIQANYNEMYRALPLDQQNKVKCAASSMENIRLRSPLEAQAILATERSRAEQSMTTSVSQMLVADAVKTQIDNARRETSLRINEKILELKARRSAHR
jgi:hypothetical protein